MANMMPNIANDTSVASIVPQVNPAERNSGSSTSGRSPPAPVSTRSQAAKPASRAAPVIMVAIAAGPSRPGPP